MTKLNNKGQSLALFIVIIPVLILVGIYVIDIGNLKYNEKFWQIKEGIPVDRQGCHESSD